MSSGKIKLINSKNQKIVSNDTKIIKGFLDTALGLHKKGVTSSIIFNTRFGIHTFFLKKEIDVLILDKDNKVVKKTTVKPNQIYVWNPKYSRVVELPANSIKQSGIKIGNKIIED